MITFIKKAKVFFKEFTEFLGEVKAYRRNQDIIATHLVSLIEMKEDPIEKKRFDALIVKNSEMLVKQEELIRFMTQFFLTSEKAKREEEIQKKKDIEDKKPTPDDARY